MTKTINERFEQAVADGCKVVKYFQARGESIRGRITKRDGKSVNCGHQHKTAASAEVCRRRMQRVRPGNCQKYGVGECVAVHIVKR